jgi:hypothetical protein
MDDLDILRAVLAGVPAGDKRRREIIDWGYLLGLSESEALQIARGGNLIPSTHPPQKRRGEKPPDKGHESTDE